MGVIAGRFIDEQGQPIAGPLDERTIGMSLDMLKTIDMRIAIAGGFDKVQAILAALRGGYVDVLITDAATGRGIAGLGKAAAHLRQLRFRGADCYAQPSTVAGRDIMKATGFVPVPSFQPDLWCYERPWHRQAMRMPGAIIQARSFADARH